MNKATILIVGPTPPPYMGPSVATKMILESELNERFKLVHMDTSDRRSGANVGKIDITNIILAIWHVVKVFYLVCVHTPSVVYLPISQTVIGYFRDILFMCISALCKAKIVVHLRGGYFRELYEKSSHFVKFIIKISCRIISKAIVLDNSLRYIFKDLVPDGQIVVVPNGIDTHYISDDVFKKTLQSRDYYSKEKKIRILFLSNLILTKGYFDVIRSLKAVIRHIKDIELILAGDFYEGEQIKDQINEYIHQNKLEQFIKFVGPAIDKQKKELLLSADIFVFPTYYHAEGQPWVIIEAMAAGLPIISTDQGCIKSMVVNGENGFIVEKQNPLQLAEKIIELANDQKLRIEMGQRSRERFLAYYTKDIFIERLKKVFDAVLQTNVYISDDTAVMRRPTIVVTGPMPPPFHGVTIITSQILKSKVVKEFDIIHHDTSDHRSIKNIGKIDIQNCWLAIRHTISIISILYHNRVAIVYLPICQSIIGIIRDGMFMLLAKTKKAKVIVHLHGGYFKELYDKSLYFSKSIIKKACSFIENAIVIGESFKHIFHGLIDDSRIVVVSNAVDKDYITNENILMAYKKRISRSTDNGIVTILYLSNLIITKGYFDIIKAIPDVMRVYRNVKFTFAGEFENKKHEQLVANYVSKHNIQPYIDFLGTVTGAEKKKVLLSADIYALPTYYPGEGQPLSILEAMAAGLPVISTDHGCIKEMVIDGKNGFLVEKRNSRQIAEKIQILLRDIEKRLCMGKASRQHFLKHFTSERFIIKLTNAFHTALQHDNAV